MAGQTSSGKGAPVVPGGGERNPGDEVAPGTPQTGENICPDCHGTGRSGDGACRTCGGTGRVTENVGDA